MSHTKFPSIEGFVNVWKQVGRTYDLGERPTIAFQGKVKLHGTNAGVRVHRDGSVISQKRSDDCFVGDHFGFPAWVQEHKDEWLKLVRQISHTFDKIVVHGEWAGPGIQKSVAVSKLEEKQFFVFAVETELGLYIDPTIIDGFFNNIEVPRMHIIPWATERYSIDFSDAQSTEKIVAELNALVNEIDKIDPYMKDHFGIEGVGEGLVFYPCEKQFLEPRDRTYLFKVKGGSHAKNGAAKPAKMAPSVSGAVIDFAKEHVHEARLEQGKKEIWGDEVPDTSKIGAFLGWLARDIEKECQEEMAASGYNWKSVSGPCMLRAREWIFNEIKQGGLDG